MKQRPSIPPASPRKWLSTVAQFFGHDYLARLFNVGERAFRKWLTHPDYASEDSIRANYLEKHEGILTRLMDDGYDTVARAIVSRHAELVGCSLVCRDIPKPDKETIEAESLDDYPSLVGLHTALQAGEDMDTVRHLKEKHFKEVDETVELYRQMQ